MHEFLTRSHLNPQSSHLLRAVLWVWGKALLALYSSSPTVWRQKWASFLAAEGVDFDRYCWSCVGEKNITYVRLSQAFTRAYVGSTSDTVFGRENTRRRKYKQRGADLGQRCVHRLFGRFHRCTELTHPCAFCCALVGVCCCLEH